MNKFLLAAITVLTLTAAASAEARDYTDGERAGQCVGAAIVGSVVAAPATIIVAAKNGKAALAMESAIAAASCAGNLVYNGPTAPDEQELLSEEKQNVEE